MLQARHGGTAEQRTVLRAKGRQTGPSEWQWWLFAAGLEEAPQSECFSAQVQGPGGPGSPSSPAV